MNLERAITASRYASGYSARNCFGGVVRTELQLALREPSLPFVLVGLLAFCQLLMPPPDAPYAVLTVNSLKPLMAAGPMILATGAVFSAIAFPAYILYLGQSRSRDTTIGLGPLYLSMPASTPLRALGITSGRLVANMLLAFGSLWIVLVLLLLAVRIKAGEWPDVTSVVAYFGVSAPVVITAACAAVIVDAVISSHSLKSTIVMGLWMALLLASVSFQQFDFFGLRFVGQNILPDQASPALAVGLIGGKINTIPWNVVYETATHLLERLQLVVGIAGIGSLAALGLAATFRSRYAAGRSRPSPEMVAGSLSGSAISAHSLPPQAMAQLISVWQAVFLIAQRRLKHAKWTKVLMLAAVVLGISTHQLSNAATMALLIPITLFGRHPSRSLASERAVCFTISGLWKPTPSLMETFALWSLIIVPVLLGSIGSGVSLTQLVHFLVGALAASAWMVFSHHVLRRQLLGVSVYLLLWYFVACNRLPAPLDLLGIHGTSLISFAAALAITSVLSLAIAWEGHRR